MPTEVFVLFGLFLLNGVFAMSEIALVTARRARLQAMVEQGDHGAAAAHTAPDDHASGGGADYAHMVGDASSQPGGAQPPQEPPPADHLFADAHVDQGAHDGGGSAPPGADAPADATPPPEPPPEHHDQGSGNMGH